MYLFTFEKVNKLLTYQLIKKFFMVLTLLVYRDCKASISEICQIYLICLIIISFVCTAITTPHTFSKNQLFISLLNIILNYIFIYQQNINLQFQIFIILTNILLYKCKTIMHFNFYLWITISEGLLVMPVSLLSFS